MSFRRESPEPHEEDDLQLQLEGSNNQSHSSHTKSHLTSRTMNKFYHFHLFLLTEAGWRDEKEKKGIKTNDRKKEIIIVQQGFPSIHPAFLPTSRDLQYPLDTNP